MGERHVGGREAIVGVGEGDAGDEGEEEADGGEEFENLHDFGARRW